MSVYRPLAQPVPYLGAPCALVVPVEYDLLVMTVLDLGGWFVVQVLIFSQFSIMLDLLEQMLHFRQYRYERMDGRIRGNLRQVRLGYEPPRVFAVGADGVPLPPPPPPFRPSACSCRSSQGGLQGGAQCVFV